MIYDIGIIGAGVAGLTAALEAKTLGLNVVLFEKRNLGGLSFNGGEITVRKFLEIIQDYSTIGELKDFDINKALNIIQEKQTQSIHNYLKLFKGAN